MKNITKLFFAAAFLTVGAASAQTGGVGVGTTTPDASSALDVTSTTKGFLMPRMTTTERTAITSPATGLQVYDTDTNSQWYYNGTVWVQGASKADGSKWTNDATNTRVALTNLSDGTTARTAGTEFIIKDNGRVGIGTDSPTSALQVKATVAQGVFSSSVAGGHASISIGDYLGTVGNVNFWNINRRLTPYFGEDLRGLAFWGDTNDGSFVAPLLLQEDGDIILAGATSANTINGKVGIGTNVPVYKLDVVGDIRMSNASYLYSRTSTGSNIRMMGINPSNVAYVGPIDNGPYASIFNASPSSNEIYLNVGGNPRVRLTVNGLTINGNSAPRADLDVLGSGAIVIPTGTTSQQPSTPVAGMIRFNSTTSKFEGYNGTAWVAFH